MATEVLRSHDRLATDRFLHRRRNIPSMPSLIVADTRPYSYNNGHRKTSDHKTIDGRSKKKTPSTSPSTSPPHLAGPVTLLRRGESLDSLTKSDLNQDRNKCNNSVGSSKSPDFNPHDEVSLGKREHRELKDRKKSRSRGYKSCDDVSICGARQIKLSPARDVYAGSGFCLSPSPRSLPLPSFFSNMKAGNCDVDSSQAKMFEDSATSGLRRLLRLD